MTISRVTCNHSPSGRYRFDNQPAVKVEPSAACAKPVAVYRRRCPERCAGQLSGDPAARIWCALMRNKLGLMTQEKGDNALSGRFAIMVREDSDYTRTFRMLSQTAQQSAASRCATSSSIVRRLMTGLPFTGRLQQEQMPTIPARRADEGGGPRRWCCATGWQSGPLSRQEQGCRAGRKPHIALRTPFADREDYVSRPPDWGKRLEVSCSS